MIYYAYNVKLNFVYKSSYNRQLYIIITFLYNPRLYPVWLGIRTSRQFRDRLFDSGTLPRLIILSSFVRSSVCILSMHERFEFHIPGSVGCNCLEPTILILIFRAIEELSRPHTLVFGVLAVPLTWPARLIVKVLHSRSANGTGLHFTHWRPRHCLLHVTSCGDELWNPSSKINTSLYIQKIFIFQPQHLSVTMRLTSFIISVVFFSGIARAFPSYQSLAGWSREEVDLFIREHGEGLGAQSLPPVQMDNSSKLVHDAEHPYMAPGPNDRRGPCPGLNTLANHGVSFNVQVSFYTEFP